MLKTNDTKGMAKMKKEALLLIDIQELYFTPGPMLLHNPQAAADNARVVLDKFRAEGKTVIHVKHEFKNFADIHDTVAPLVTEKIVSKKHPSAFLQTDLDEYLKEQQIESLVVAGMMSHMCVDTTVRACQDRGYEVVLIADACTTKSLNFNGKEIDAETVHAAFMASLSGKFAKVMALDEYLNEK